MESRYYPGVEADTIKLMLRCNPRPNETIVTITATPTITPIEVNVARNFASRRFLKDRCNKSRNDMTEIVENSHRITYFGQSQNVRFFAHFWLIFSRKIFPNSRRWMQRHRAPWNQRFVVVKARRVSKQKRDKPRKVTSPHTANDT